MSAFHQKLLFEMPVMVSASVPAEAIWPRPSRITQGYFSEYSYS